MVSGTKITSSETPTVEIITSRITTKENNMHITVGPFDMGTITIPGIEFLADFVPLTRGLETKWARMEGKMQEYPEEGKNLAEKIGLDLKKKENIVAILWGSYREEGTFSGPKDMWVILYKDKNNEKLWIAIVTPDGRYAKTEIRPSSIELSNPAPVAMGNNGLPATYTPPPYLSMNLFKTLGLKIEGLTPPQTSTPQTSTSH